MTALDRDAAALALAAGARHHHHAGSTWKRQGAAWPFAPGRFAGIVVTNYLHRPLMAQLAASLRPDGVLIYETFAIGNEAFGKPSNPAFLLARGELLEHARARRPGACWPSRTATAAAPKPAMVQRLCAGGPAFPARNAVLAPCLSVRF